MAFPPKLMSSPPKMMMSPHKMISLPSVNIPSQHKYQKPAASHNSVTSQSKVMTSTHKMVASQMMTSKGSNQVVIPDGLGRSQTFIRTFVSYTRELEAYILRNHASPPDMEYWPYGPYWPKTKQDEPDWIIFETPKHIRRHPRIVEPLWNSVMDG